MLELEVKVEVEVLAKENPDFYYHIVMSGMQSLATSPQVELAPFYQPVEPLFTLDTLEETSMFDLRVLEPDEKYPNCIRFHFLSDGQIVGNRLLTLYPDGNATIRNRSTRKRRHFPQKELEGHTKPEDVEALANSYRSLLVINNADSMRAASKILPDDALIDTCSQHPNRRWCPIPSCKQREFVSAAAFETHCDSDHPREHECPACSKGFPRLDSATRHLITSPDCLREASKIPPDNAPIDTCLRHPDKRRCPVSSCKKREFESPTFFETHRNSDHPSKHQCLVCPKSYMEYGGMINHLITSPKCMREASTMPPDDAPIDTCSRHPDKRWCPVPSCKKREFESSLFLRLTAVRAILTSMGVQRVPSYIPK
ncbi:unnamed protein product [Rhizoctonia solani]|nr:unnamed protein product [Rhizoctonia solani]